MLQQKTHSSALQFQQKAETLIQSNHFSPEIIRTIAAEVSNRWQQLMSHAEDRHKLVMASLSFFKTADQVYSVLDSLEREYQREEDLCEASQLNQSHSEPTPVACKEDIESLLVQQIGRHQEQKEAFLKACTLARRNAETFLKYAARCIQYYSTRTGSNVYKSAETDVKNIMDKLLKQENEVLDCWTQKKKRLDHCQQYVLVEHSAKQALKWINEQGIKYITTKKNSIADNTNQDLELVLKDCYDFKANAKEAKEKVRLLIHLADNLVEKGNTHSNAIKKWVTFVDHCYNDFSRQLEEFKADLENRLGLTALDRNSQHSLESNSASLQSPIESPTCATSPTSLSSNKVQTSSNSTANSQEVLVVDQEKRKSARKREFIMAELLGTERTYVKDLRICIETYLYDYRRNSCHLPIGIAGKERNIFGNIEQIYNFHNEYALYFFRSFTDLFVFAVHS